MRLGNRRWGLGAAVVASWAMGGCGLLLGLDEYGPQTCDDGIKGEGEADVDCGGICGKVCGDGMGCGKAEDCESGVCGALGLCEAASCSDGVKNGGESDKDCGGSCGATCRAGGLCEGKGDCVGGVCEGGVCAATCTDKEKNGSETDVDCGGADCGVCEIGQGCVEAGDCESGICHAVGCVAEHVWSMRFGDAAEQTALSTAIDNAGNVIVAGTMKGTVDFGGGPITSPPNGAYFITKMDAGGKHLWTKTFGQSIDTSLSIDVDSNGNIFAACASSTSINFGGETLSSIDGIDVFIAKLDQNGNHVWSNVFGGISSDRVTSIKSTSMGNIIIAGDFYGSVDFGNGALSNNDNFTDVFVAELTNDGSPVWSKSFPCTASLGFVKLALRTDGSIILGGVFFGKEVNFGGGALQGAGGTEIYVAAIDSAGQHIWSKRFGGPDTQSLLGLGVDSLGNVILGGHFNASFDLGGSTLPFMGGSDAFVAKLGASGEHLWSKAFGDAAMQHISVVAADSSGKVLIGGAMSGTVDFGGGPVVANDQDIFLVALTQDGTHVWSRRYGGSDAQDLNAITSDDPGNLIVAGNLKGFVNFGDKPLTSAGLTDIFIAKLAYP